MSDLFGVAGGRLLDQLQLGRAYGLRVASLRSLIGAYDQEITTLQREVTAALAGDIGYLAIQAIPGVGPVPAGRVRGRDRRRPPLRRRATVVLLGRTHAPPPRVRHHRASRPHHQTGPRLVRWAAVQATQRLPRGSKQAAWFHRIADRAAPASAASPPPAGCSPWSPTASGMARSAAWPRHRGRRCERLGRSPARARGCHDPHPGGVVARLVEPARLRPDSSMPPWRGEGMTGTPALSGRPQPAVAGDGAATPPQTLHWRRSRTQPTAPSLLILPQPLTTPRIVVLAALRVLHG
jgi:hypothetical protein